MYVVPPTFGGVCAFIDGFDSARDNGPLHGLKEWLVLRANSGNNLHWSGLAEKLLGVRAEELSPKQHADAILRMGLLLEEFFKYREQNGVAVIYQDYGRWLLKRKWYDGPLRKRRRKST